MKSPLQSVCIFISTGLGVGYLPAWLSARFGLFNAASYRTGAGLLGALEGFLLAAAGGFRSTGWRGLAMLTVLTLAAIPVAGAAENALERKDDPRIVIDEIIGFLWTVALIPLDSFTGIKKWTVLLAALVLFRVFDIYKLPFRRVQNLQGGLGVMMDDILSGLFANLILQIGLRIIG